jgi:hypothetical protein
MNQSLRYYCRLAQRSLLIVLLLCVCPQALAREPNTLGWIERIRVDPHNFTLKAKLDTGAELSSIDESDIDFFERNKKKWVRFSLRDENGKYITKFKEEFSEK